MYRNKQGIAIIFSKTFIWKKKKTQYHHALHTGKLIQNLIKNW